MDWPYVALILAGLGLIVAATWLVYRLGGSVADPRREGHVGRDRQDGRAPAWLAWLMRPDARPGRSAPAGSGDRGGGAMADASDDRALAAACLAELYAQVGGALNGTTPAARLQEALGWDAARFAAVGRRLDLAGSVRLHTGYVRLLADGKRRMEGG